MKISISTFLASIGLAALFASCANPLDVLGPRDKRKIVSDQWSQLDVTYWVFTAKDSQEFERKFTISDSSVITRFKSELHLRRTEGLSIGTGSQLVFKGADGEIWQGDIVFEDTLYLSLSEDAWRSYKFTLKDGAFYDDLREVCAANERKYHSNATSKHIKLRSNLRFEYPKL
jgi:hypothetical protein